MSHGSAVSPRQAVEEAGALLAAAGLPVRRGFPLAPMTSLRVGGPAALYLEGQSERDLSAAAEAIRSTGIPWTVIGKGSNVLVSDHGFAGLVLRLGRGFRWAARDGVMIEAGGSMHLPALAGIALSHSLAGLEFGVAIPGSLGGAVRMNAGAHGGAVQHILERIDLYSIPLGRHQALAAEEARFDYRHSQLPPGSVVVGATVRLRQGRPEHIRKRMEEARTWRRATQPLAEPNFGSVFKNPAGGHAARLVEAAGGKGLSVGAVSVSEKHANFMVARPGATARDAYALLRLVQRLVEDRFGVSLEPEVRLVGDFGGPSA